MPRPSEAQRLQMHSRGGARRAGPPALGGSSGSPEDYSWNTAFGPDPHARIEESRHEFIFDCHDPGVHRCVLFHRFQRYSISNTFHN